MEIQKENKIPIYFGSNFKVLNRSDLGKFDLVLARPQLQWDQSEITSDEFTSMTLELLNRITNVTKDTGRAFLFLEEGDWATQARYLEALSCTSDQYQFSILHWSFVHRKNINDFATSTFPIIYCKGNLADGLHELNNWSDTAPHHYFKWLREEQSNSHEAAIPKKLIRQLIVQCTKVQDRVLDVFVNENHFLSVAEKMGRSVVGIDHRKNLGNYDLSAIEMKCF